MRDLRPSGDKSIHVLHIGPNVDADGGISSVIRLLVRVASLPTTAVSTWHPSAPLSGALEIPGAVKTVLQYRRAVDELIIHVHISEGGSLLREGAFVCVGWLLRATVVSTFHGASLRTDRLRERLFLRAFNATSHVITLLSTHQECLFPGSSKVRYISNPATDVGIAPAPFRFSFLFAGIRSRRKGLDTLLSAWVIVRRALPTAVLRIAGPAGDVSVGNLDGIEDLGRLDPVEMLDEIGRAAWVVLPSRREVLPMILVESMAAGRPWISVERDGMIDLAKEGGGLLVSGDDPEVLAATMISAATELDWSEWSANSRSAWERWHDPQLVSSKYEASYVELSSDGA